MPLAAMQPIAAFPAAAQSWQSFYLLTGGAAATLTGLMFIAVTFGARLVNKQSVAAARAFIDPTYTHFGQVLFTAAVLTIPILDATALAILLFLVAAGRLVALVWVYRQLRRVHARLNDLERSDWLVAIVFPAAAYVVLLATAAAFWQGWSIAFVGLAVVTLGLLAIGIFSAWELVIWMAVVVGASNDSPAAEGEEHEGRDSSPAPVESEATRVR